MRIEHESNESVRVVGGSNFRGIWLPTDPAQRPKIRNDQVLEIRRSHQECRDFNTLVTYGKLCDNYEEEEDRVMHVLVYLRAGSMTDKLRRQAIRYILKWFMARVQGKAIQAPRKAVKKVVKRRVRTRIGTIHLNVGVHSYNRRYRYVPCNNGVALLERTTTVRERVTCGSCQRTIKYRRLIG